MDTIYNNTPPQWRTNYIYYIIYKNLVYDKVTFQIPGKHELSGSLSWKTEQWNFEKN